MNDCIFKKIRNEKGVVDGRGREIAALIDQRPTETSKQQIRARYLGHVTGYQPIRDQYFMVRSVADST